MPGIGQSVQDGEFEFVVNGLECGATSVGSQYFSETAQGEYCLLRLTVKNVGTEQQSFFTDAQKLLSPEGVEYSADSAATYTRPLVVSLIGWLPRGLDWIRARKQCCCPCPGEEIRSAAQRAGVMGGMAVLGDALQAGTLLIGAGGGGDVMQQPVPPPSAVATTVIQLCCS